MIIDRFGTATTYAGAFQLIHASEIDDWTITRPPVTTQIAGAGGAYDFYGTANYPLAPMTLTKSFMATASTWAGVATALDNLDTYTIYAGEGRLWATARDGTTHYWTYAKCTALDIGYKVDGNSPPFAGTAVFGQEVSIEFFCRTGEWYPESQSSATAYTAAFTVELLDGSNNLLTVPGTSDDAIVENVISVSVEDRLDEAGRVSFTVPATDNVVAQCLSTAARFRVKSSTGSIIAYGIIDSDTIDATATQPNRTVTGGNMLRELQHYTMGWWCFFDDKDIVDEVIPGILNGTGWTLKTTDTSGNNIYYRFDGDSRLAALIKIAEATGKHFRLTSTFRELEWGDFFNAYDPPVFYSRYNDGNYVSYGEGWKIIGALEVTSDSAPVVNRIYPWGAGHDDGNLNRAKVSLFHLDPNDTRWANIKAKAGIRGSQATVSDVDWSGSYYTVNSTSGFITWPIQQLLWCYDPADLTQGMGYDFVVRNVLPSTSQIVVRGSPTKPAKPTNFPAYLIGNPQLYIEDATAYAANPHEAVVIFDDITLTDLSLNSFALAAAQLYDRAAQYLATHKSPQMSYAVTVYNCPETLRPGDVVHITYGGYVTRNGVQTDFVNIDTDLNVINITRRYNADGSTEATLEVSTIEAQAASGSGAVSRTMGSVGYHATTVGSLGVYSETSNTTTGVSGPTQPGYQYLTLNDNETAFIKKETSLGTLFVSCIEDGSVSMFALAAENHAVYEMLDPQEQFTATSGTDNMTNIYCETSAPYEYYIENKRGAQRSYYIWFHTAMIE